jgi:hypothetical protein
VITPPIKANGSLLFGRVPRDRRSFAKSAQRVGMAIHDESGGSLHSITMLTPRNDLATRQTGHIPAPQDSPKSVWNNLHN